MKRLLLITSLFFALALSADMTPQQKYIQKYSDTAIKEMYRSGVPASITLAQGLLESRYGLSELAAKGNNHFGIKCHNWKGKTMHFDDDAKGECFRVYSNAEESFSDHSDFLRYRDRYKFLFDYEITDYKAWAYGLKKAGYATDPQYPNKLIKIIEDYNLTRFDDPNTAVEEEKTETKAGTEKKAVVIPESPLKIEAARKYTKPKERFTFSLSRTLYSKNGVPFIYSLEGESYASIAKENNLFFREILKFNDLEIDEKLQPGTIVYLQKKKKKTEKGLDKYVVDTDGEKLRDISQRFGVRLNSVCKMNGFDPSKDLKEGDMVILRKK